MVVPSSPASESDDVPIQQKRSTTKRLSASAVKTKQTAEAEELKHEKEEVQEHAEKEAKALRDAEKSKATAKTTKRRTSAKKQESTDESDEEPVSKRKRTSKGKEPVAAPKKKVVKKEVKEEESSEEPVSRKTAKATSAKGKKAITNGKTPTKGKAVKAAAPDGDDDLDDPDGEQEEGEEEYRWWEDTAKGDGTEKWKTLEHAGVVFPPPYEPLPENVKLLYDGVPVTLKPEAEEVAGFFGAMLNSTVNVSNETFVRNFFHDFKEVLAKTGGAVGPDGQKIRIREFDKCDFTPIFNYYEEKKAEKKALPAAEKKRLKAEKDAAEAPYQYCLWDGRKEKVGNFRVEPPGLFRGRGDHPKTGHVKKRVRPEQITINIGEKAQVPAPPEGHHWKEVRHDHAGTWLAMWQENINNAYKYVMLAANSAIKGQSDFNKFEKARELKVSDPESSRSRVANCVQLHIDRIREDYRQNLRATAMVERQTATAVYLIDQLALRAGNEKGEDEADTVGCCSLKFEHVTLRPPNTVIFDFLGKDSIRFYQEVEIDEQVFKNLKIFKKEPKGEGDEIFDRLKVRTF